MSEDDIKQEVKYFTGDINRWVSESDYGSASIIAANLVKFLEDLNDV